MRVDGKVVAQVVEAELCIRQVHDIALVSFLSIFHLQCNILILIPTIFIIIVIIHLKRLIRIIITIISMISIRRRRRRRITIRLMIRMKNSSNNFLSYQYDNIHTIVTT